MLKQQVDALLISAEKDIQYLTGFVGHESLALVLGERAAIISDSRYDEYLQRQRNGEQRGHKHCYESVRLKPFPELRSVSFRCNPVEIGLSSLSP